MYEEISYGHYQESGPWQDKNLYWTGFVYFIGLCALDVPWWQAGLVATSAFACWYLSYSRAALAAIGVAVLFAGLGTWVGLIPRWR
jgi:hypothetical protein